MDEEIDDERRNRINKYGAADTYTLRRLRHEIGEGHIKSLKEKTLKYNLPQV
jgi:hypothetical protein